jgi:hypothetical protein
LFVLKKYAHTLRRLHFTAYCSERTANGRSTAKPLN